MASSFLSMGPQAPSPPIMVESGSRLVDRYLGADENYKDLAHLLKIDSPNHPSVSGLVDVDYPSAAQHKLGLGALSEMSAVKKREPLPSELVEQFEHMQCNCMMGLFPEIGRAWISVDSDIFVWKYENGGDLAYFDGLSETILCAGLVRPKPGIFQPAIQYLLCLATPVEVVLLGASFISNQVLTPLEPSQCDMHLMADPLFTLSTDGVYMQRIASAENGRIFMCGKDGCLYELAYQAEDGWFSRKCRKINHSTSSLSFLVPAFLNFTFSEDDPMVQITIDESRHLLYTRSEKGTIQLYDLGHDGQSTRRVDALGYRNVYNSASSIAKTVDRTNFRNMIHIAAITKMDSVNLHLVGITQTGVRLYFSAGFSQGNNRPGYLQLVHVRLPPGFTATAAPERPINIHQAHYNQGTLLMSSSQTEVGEDLWCIGSDSFPFQDQLMETFTTKAIQGRVWTMTEVPRSLVRLQTNQSSPTRALTPLVVRQHLEPIRSFVVLTSQGTHLIDKYHPVHQLQQLLEYCKGPENDEVKAFFSLHKEEQACATCLVLACSKEANVSPQMQDWATRAFFIYGGEPRHAYSPVSTVGPTGPSGLPPNATSTPYHPSYPPNVTIFNKPGAPNFAFSTPAPHSPLHQRLPTPQPYGGDANYNQSIMSWNMNQSGAPMVVPDIQYSFKHDGICLYLSRILRPIWNCKIVSDSPIVSADGRKNFTCSRFSVQELSWFIDHLSGLRDFIDSNTQITSPVIPDGMSLGYSTLHRNRFDGQMEEQNKRRYAAEAQAQEKHSLQQVQHLIHRAYEVLGLWQILCDHQFHLVAAGLTKDQQNQLMSATFRSMVNDDKEMCLSLITCLVNRYLHDNATVDAISGRLREVCPSLYSDEDATCSKANEILKATANVTNQLEKDNLLRQALTLFKQVTGQLDLGLVCNQFANMRYFDGIVELCLSAANKRDPQYRALHYYNNGEPPEDSEGCNAYLARMDAYKCITETLRYLVSTSTDHPQAGHVPTQPGPPPSVDPNRITVADAERYSEQVLHLGLQSDDELFHVAVYEWLISMDLTDKLLEVQSPYLESFLKRAAMYRPDNMLLMDLLWKFYEKARNYSAAAKILSKLSERLNGQVGLQRRIEYLSRAIICAKSSSQRSASASDGEFLHDLEEKMEVTRLQLQIYDVLQKWSAEVPNVREALQRLNSELMDISTLYGDFAEPYNLSECKLAIIHCANHYDSTLVESLWREMIEKELECTVMMPPQTRTSSIANKLVALGRLYVSSDRYFPLPFLVKFLERCSCQAKFELEFAFSVMLNVGVKMSHLQEVYDRMFKANDKFWETSNPLHLLRVIYKLLSQFAENPALVQQFERRQFVVVCQDAIGAYLVELQSMSRSDHSVTSLVGEFKGLQAKLDRLT